MMLVQDGKPWRKLPDDVRRWLSGERHCAVCGTSCTDVYLWLTTENDLLAMALCKQEPHDHETFAVAVRRTESMRSL